MKFLQHLLVLFSFLLLTSCSEPVMDATDEETMKQSFKNMLNSLPAEEKKQFFKAYHKVVYAYKSHKGFKQKGDSKELIQSRINDLINQKTVTEIIEQAKIIKKKKAQYKIKNIEAQLLARKDDNKQLSLAKINQYKLYMTTDGFFDQIFLDVVIYNGSKYDLSHLVLAITIGSSMSHTLISPEKHIYLEFPETLKAGELTSKLIDLGRATDRFYLPKDPILAKYTTTSLEIAKEERDILKNQYPRVADLKKMLLEKKQEYQTEYENDAPHRGN